MEKKRVEAKAWAFDEMFRQSPQCAALLMENGCIEVCTKSFASLFKACRHIRDIVPEMGELKSGASSFFNAQTKEEMRFEIRAMAKENSDAFLIFFPDHCMVSAVEHEELKSEKRIYETILNSIEEGVTLIDSDGICIYSNSAAEKIEGIKKENRIGKHIKEIYTLYWPSSLQTRVIKTQKALLNIHQNYPMGGRAVEVVSNTYPFVFDNRMAGAVSIFQNFSEYKKLIEQNIDLQYQLNLNTKPDPIQSTDSQASPSHFLDIVGQCRPMIAVIQKARLIAGSGSPVLIYGETGTGKELFARSIHNAGPNPSGPFLAINCAAIPENLLEGILFGTTKGVYTGAVDKPGLFEQANGGTLFLDEINSMPIGLQGKLLRVLQEKKVRRLGEKRETPIDARVISTSNINPQQTLDTHQIRSDLFYRLAVVYLEVPPLRERGRDIIMLSDYFVKQFNRKFNKQVLSLDHKVIKAFQSYTWPGNVRQLRHGIESAMNIIPATAAFIEPCHIPEYMGLFNPDSQEELAPLSPDPMEPSVQQSETSRIIEMAGKENILEDLKEKEKEMIVQTLQRHKGKITQAAKALGISRQSLQYRLKKYDLKHLPAYLSYNTRVPGMPKG